MGMVECINGTLQFKPAHKKMSNGANTCSYAPCTNHRKSVLTVGRMCERTLHVTHFKIPAKIHTRYNILEAPCLQSRLSHMIRGVAVTNRCRARKCSAHGLSPSPGGHAQHHRPQERLQLRKPGKRQQKRHVQGERFVLKGKIAVALEEVTQCTRSTWITLRACQSNANLRTIKRSAGAIQKFQSLITGTT